MGYEKFIKKVFPFIGNLYNNQIAEGGNTPTPTPTPTPGEGYDVDGHHYDFKAQIIMAAEPIDDTVELVVKSFRNGNVVDEFHTGPLVEGLDFEDLSACDLNNLRFVPLRTLMEALDGNPETSQYYNRVYFMYQYLGRYYHHPTAPDCVSEEIELTSFIDYPPYGQYNWNAQTFGFEDMYVETCEFTEVSGSIVFYYNLGQE